MAPKKPAVGKKVTDFTLPATGGKTVRLKDLRGGPVVLYFYPRDNTPGCTTEGLEFAALHARFRRQKARVFGISRDTLAAHERFKEKFEFPFELLSDTDEKACKVFDVIKEKNMYGRKVIGIERSTFLIDADGALSNEWRKVKVKGHAQEVLDAVKALKK